MTGPDNESVANGTERRLTLTIDVPVQNDSWNQFPLKIHSHNLQLDYELLRLSSNIAETHMHVSVYVTKREDKRSTLAMERESTNQSLF